MTTPTQAVRPQEFGQTLKLFKEFRTKTDEYPAGTRREGRYVDSYTPFDYSPRLGMSKVSAPWGSKLLPRPKA